VPADDEESGHRESMATLKQGAVRILESHPLGYVISVAILDRTDRFLPHEADYLGFAVIAQRGYPGPPVILDLGANRGHSARAFLKLLPSWQVISFEANPLHARWLEQIRRRFPERFSYHIAAIADRSGIAVDIFTPYYGSLAMHSSASTDAADAMRGVDEAWPRLKGRFRLCKDATKTLAVDDLSLAAGFVKLDIQGGELGALKGMEATVRRSQAILLVEMNLTKDDVVGYFDRLGYRPWSFDPISRCFRRTASRETRNLFFVPRCHERFLMP
jgi:FkbM family methyltransferase